MVSTDQGHWFERYLGWRSGQTSHKYWVSYRCHLSVEDSGCPCLAPALEPRYPTSKHLDDEDHRWVQNSLELLQATMLFHADRLRHRRSRLSCPVLHGIYFDGMLLLLQCYYPGRSTEYRCI